MKFVQTCAMLALTLLSLSGCAPDEPGRDLSGKWQGVEGTYLVLTDKGGDAYDVAIRDLDSERIFSGVRSGDTIAFTRDGRHESVHPGNGPATGMKWLQDKTDCLIVNAGEGYCRN